MYRKLLEHISHSMLNHKKTAAHDDANIIFGAVLDDKMKDSVKITVIATGFKDSDTRRQQEVHDPFITAREPAGFSEPDFDPEPVPAAVAVQQPMAEASMGQSGVISLSAGRSMVANLEQD